MYGTCLYYLIYQTFVHEAVSSFQYEGKMFLLAFYEWKIYNFKNLYISVWSYQEATYHLPPW